MARDGSGTYNLPAGNPVVTGTAITISWANGTLNDIKDALTASISKDGQTTPTANLPMGTYRHTGVGGASARNCYTSVPDVQDGVLTSLSSVSGADAIIGTAALSMAAYATGQEFIFISAAANTGAATLNINGIGAKDITKNGTTALAAGDIPNGAAVKVAYDGTRFQMIGCVANKAQSGANTDITSLNAPELGSATATTQSPNDNSTKVATTAYADAAAAAVAYTPTGFGNWSTVTPESAPIQAATDGLLVCVATTTSTSNGMAIVTGLTDASATPTTIRGGCYLYGHANALYANGQYASFTMPVREGDYYSASATTGIASTRTYYWIPVGS